MQTQYFLIFMVFIISMLQISMAIRINSRDILHNDPVNKDNDILHNYPVNKDNGPEYSINEAIKMGIPPDIGAMLDQLEKLKEKHN